MTRISDMTPLTTLPASGAYVPVEKAGSSTNYRFDLSNMVKLPTAATISDLGLYYRLTGSAWPEKDLAFDHLSHGEALAPIITDAGPADFFTPFRRSAFLAAAHKGGLQTALFDGQIRGAPHASSTNLNYTPIQGLISATVNLGGTGLTGATAKGALFGSAFLAVAYPGATNLLNITGCEYNIQIQAGASAAIKTGNQIVQMSDDAVSGSLVDAGLAFSNIGGAVGWNMVLCLSHLYNGQHSVKSSGTLVGVLGTPSCAKGIDLGGVTFSGNAWTSPGSIIDKDGNQTALTLTITAATPTVAAGKLGIGTTTATSANTGANGATPAQVLGYLVMNLAGTPIKVPYYAA